MTRHAYGLQFILYSLALHQYLKHRLPGYDYARHFGGIQYLFVRGMDGQTTQTGIYAHKPDLALLDALEALLQPQEVRDAG
jgi:exodeoxyribonuclease V beta subunit